jgi:hypothetical protein
MNEQLFDALQECLTALEQGEELDRILARFPELEQELRPALEAAVFASAAIDFSVPPDSISRSRTRLLGHASKLRESRKKTWFGLPRLDGAALAVIFVLLVGVSGLVTASAQALPGDTLYSMKLAVEDVRLSFTTDAGAKQSLRMVYDQRRIDETVKLIELGRSERVTFEGVVSEIDGETWLVNEIRVKLSPNTKIVGIIELGMAVEVEGEVQLGKIVEAIKITLLDVDDEEDTEDLEPTEEEGIHPTEDDKDGPDDTDKPDETPDPDESDEPEGTKTSGPDDTNEPDETDTSEPSDTDDPSTTPEPDETDTPDSIDTPDETDEPDETAEPDITPEAEDSPEPEDTPDN